MKKQNGFSCYLEQRCSELGVDLNEVLFYANQIKCWDNTVVTATINEMSLLQQEYI